MTTTKDIQDLLTYIEIEPLVDEPMLYHGFRLSVKRDLATGALQGFIQKQSGDAFSNEALEIIEDMFHGGIQYQTEQKPYTYGFVCATLDDLIPCVERDRMNYNLPPSKGTYKDKDFVLSTLQDCADNINRIE